MRILLVEDHVRFAEFARNGLIGEGFTVDVVTSAGSADAAFSAVNFDAVVLDLGLPDTDGLTLLKSWRSRGDDTPVLILTARDGVDDRVRGLNAGADDYLLKPFAMEELVARLRALLRRPGGALGVVIEAVDLVLENVFRNHPAEAAHQVFEDVEFPSRDGDRFAFDPHLACRGVEGQVAGFDEEVSSNSVEVHVSRLRKRLAGTESEVKVHTIRGVGYLLSDHDRNSDGDKTPS